MRQKLFLLYISKNNQRTRYFYKQRILEYTTFINQKAASALLRMPLLYYIIKVKA